MSPYRPKDSRVPKIDALDLIYSCSICHETLNDVYRNAQNENGLDDGRQQDDEQITRMWLASCGHFFCGRHLEGGGSVSSCLNLPSTHAYKGSHSTAMINRLLRYVLFARSSTMTPLRNRSMEYVGLKRENVILQYLNRSSLYLQSLWTRLGRIWTHSEWVSFLRT